MKPSFALALLSIALLPAAALAQKAPAAYPVTYEGGSLPLSHNKVRASLDKNEVIFMQRGQRIAVPISSITSISYGTELHPRVPLVHLGESEAHYVGVSWTGAQVLLKLSRSECRQFLTALEQATGIKAIDTNQVPSVVRYNL